MKRIFLIINTIQLKRTKFLSYKNNPEKIWEMIRLRTKIKIKRKREKLSRLTRNNNILEKNIRDSYSIFVEIKNNGNILL
jgi:hypothetical protein